MTPKVLVLGAGSIGQRHARNLVDLGADVTVMDVDEPRAHAVAGATGASFDVSAAAAHDGVVVASPTSLHAGQLAELVGLSEHILVEKPMVADVTELDVVRGAEHQVMVGYNLRHHAPIIALHRLHLAGALGRSISARFWFGSWLPDWRPQVDYRQTYSAQRALGGGVLVDAIHELDLAAWFFGPDLAVAGSVVSSCSALELDVEDSVAATLRTPDGIPIVVTLDYVSRVYRRGVEIIGDEATARFDWSTSTLTVERANGVETERFDEPVDGSYVAEAQSFLGWIAGDDVAFVDGAEGAVSVRLASRITEKALR